MKIVREKMEASFLIRNPTVSIFLDESKETNPQSFLASSPFFSQPPLKLFPL